MYTYSPSDVSILIAGHEISGLADGTFVTIEPEEKFFETKRNADGSMSRTLKRTQPYKLVLSITQTSPSNDYLNLLLNLDKTFADAVVPAYIKDWSSGTSILIAQIWIDSLPQIVYANGMEMREWELCFTSEIISLSGENQDGLYQTFLKTVSSGLPSFDNLRTYASSLIGG